MVRPLLLLMCLLLLLISNSNYAQSALSGIIHSSEDSVPLPGVTIINKQSQHVVSSDEQGKFNIPARKGDTILLKRLGFTPLLYITQKEKTNIYLRMTPQPIELKGVTLLQYHRLTDSMRLREEYRSSFDFRRPRWNEVIPYVGIGFAININQLSKALHFKDNRRKEKFRSVLLEKEKENLVDRVFTREVVTSVTGMEGDSVTQFMLRFTPDYDFVKNATAYDLYEYIKQRYVKYFRKQDTVILPQAHFNK